MAHTLGKSGDNGVINQGPLGVDHKMGKSVTSNV